MHVYYVIVILRFGLFQSCHSYRRETPNCPTHARRSNYMPLFLHTELDGNSGLDFDSQGLYLASVTRSGCLTILDFQQLYCCLNGQGLDFYDESMNWHTCIKRKLDIVKWNTSNENEILQLVACEIEEGFSDMVFSPDGDSRLIASAFDGGVYVWDWRIGNLPCMKFIKKVKVGSWKDGVTSVETSIDERVIFAGNYHGHITSWDIRRGTQSSTRMQDLDNRDIESMMPVMTMREGKTVA